MKGLEGIISGNGHIHSESLVIPEMSAHVVQSQLKLVNHDVILNITLELSLCSGFLDVVHS